MRSTDAASSDVGTVAGGIRALLDEAIAERVTPSAVAVVVVDGVGTGLIATGDAVRFGGDGRLLAAPVPATSDTLYDLASVTKVVTAVTALSLVDDGTLTLDEPIARRLPVFATGDRAGVTLRHLLTHTSGLPPVWEGWRTDAALHRADALAAITSSPLVRAPGTAFEYSCVGYNTVMALAEAATATPWRELVDARVLAPLRTRDPRGAALTMSPDPAVSAATEYQSGRGMVRGIVHDEAAAALGGGAGNAGLFGTAEAVAALGALLLDGVPGVLEPATAAELWRDQLPGILGDGFGTRGPGYGHGLGVRIGQTEWMSDRGGSARGHNGFTGTSLLVDRDAGLIVVLLTNRVHPSRELSDVRALRADVAGAAYRAVGV